MAPRQSSEELKKKYLQALEYERAKEAKARTANAQKERKAETRRQLIVGAIYLKKARLDAAFKAQHEALLKAELTRPGDRELFGLAEAGQ